MSNPAAERMSKPGDTAGVTRAQRVLLQLATDMGGTCHVFPDQRQTASVLEMRGLIQINGKLIDRWATITEAGRTALAKSGAA